MASEKISIDVDAVSQLATRIASVADELRNASCTFSNPPGIADDQVRNALEEFNKAWSDKRKKLVEQLEGAGKALDNASTQFHASDTGLAGALKGEGG